MSRWTEYGNLQFQAQDLKVNSSFLEVFLGAFVALGYLYAQLENAHM